MEGLGEILVRMLYFAATIGGLIYAFGRVFSWAINPLQGNLSFMSILALIILFQVLLRWHGLWSWLHGIPGWIKFLAVLVIWIIGFWGEWYHKRHHPEDL